MEINDLYTLFPDKSSCIDFLEKIRWADGIKCPYCNASNITGQASELRHHCNSCNTGFSVTVRTLFAKSKIELQKWFYLIIKSEENLVTESLRDLGENLNITKDTARKMLTSIKVAKIESTNFINKLYEKLKNITNG